MTDFMRKYPLDPLKRVQASHPNYSNAPEAQIRAAKFSLNDAQLVVAREYGAASWPKLKEHVESLLLESAEPMDLFKTAFKEDDAVFFRKLVKRYPEARTKINEPIAAFDSPAIIHVRGPEMLDALLEAIQLDSNASIANNVHLCIIHGISSNIYR